MLLTVNKNSKISGWTKRVQDQVKGLLKRLWKWRRSGAVVVCLAIVAAAVWWWQDLWAWWQCRWAWMGDGSDEKISNGETLRNLALIGAALGGLLIGIPLALWRNIVATLQVKTSEWNLRNERYQTGANMLGSDTLATRLGGIYALEHLAKDHPDEYHIQIMKLLCAFVRYPPTDKSFDAKGSGRPDVEVAVQAIGTRGENGKKLESDEKWLLDLREANLRGAELEDANLTGARIWFANLTDAYMFRVNLTDANMSRVNISGTWLDQVQGLTQESLNMACALKDSPPKISESTCAKTGEPLTWTGGAGEPRT